MFLEQVAQKQYEDPELVKIARTVQSGKNEEFRFDDKRNPPLREQVMCTR